MLNLLVTGSLRALGSAIACYQAAHAFSMNRMVFDQPIASYQMVQERLVRMVIEITKAQLLNYHLGRLLDQNRAKPSQISMAKLNNVREAMKIARWQGIFWGQGDLSGSSCYPPSLHLERSVRWKGPKASTP